MVNMFWRQLQHDGIVGSPLSALLQMMAMTRPGATGLQLGQAGCPGHVDRQ